MRARTLFLIPPPKSLALLATLALAAGIAATANSATPSSTSLPADRMRNSYEIYSLLIPGEVFANMDSSQKQGWAIAQVTVSAQDINPALAPEAALQPPSDHPELFKEAVTDYNLHKNQRVLLTRAFQLDRPYVLLDPAEVAEFHSARGGTDSSSALQQKYRGYPGITYFGQVYFDTHQTAALVYMLDWCGNLCAQAEWVYLERTNGQWVRRSGKAVS